MAKKMTTAEFKANLVKSPEGYHLRSFIHKIANSPDFAELLTYMNGEKDINTADTTRLSHLAGQVILLEMRLKSAIKIIENMEIVVDGQFTDKEDTLEGLGLKTDSLYECTQAFRSTFFDTVLEPGTKIVLKEYLSRGDESLIGVIVKNAVLPANQQHLLKVYNHSQCFVSFSELRNFKEV